jgi:hypothetical protein
VLNSTGTSQFTNSARIQNRSDNIKRMDIKKQANKKNPNRLRIFEFRHKFLQIFSDLHTALAAEACQAEDVFFLV